VVAPGAVDPGFGESGFGDQVLLNRVASSRGQAHSDFVGIVVFCLVPESEL